MDIYKETRDANGRLHSLDDKPAKVTDGTYEWFKNGQRHRDNNKPAIIYPSGAKSWYKDNLVHRDDGPAFTYSNGDEAWYMNGNSLNKKQIELLKKIIASEIQHLPWLLNEDELLNSVIEKRMTSGE
jgi:hypothetical protein